MKSQNLILLRNHEDLVYVVMCPWCHKTSYHNREDHNYCCACGKPVSSETVRARPHYMSRQVFDRYGPEFEERFNPGPPVLSYYVQYRVTGSEDYSWQDINVGWGSPTRQDIIRCYKEHCEDDFDWCEHRIVAQYHPRNNYQFDPKQPFILVKHSPAKGKN